MTIHTIITGNDLELRGPPAQYSAAAPQTDLGRWSCDPLEADKPSDELVMVTPRRLLRLAIAAADAGARFSREGLDIDPVAWMIAPRQLFDGRSAMDACQDLDHFHRSVVLHGLNIGLDASPSDIDELLADDGDEADASLEFADHGMADDDHAERRLPRPHLLTCWLDATEDGKRLFAFCAMVTDRPTELVERVIGRYGADAVESAVFSTGFDHTTPMATAMISDVLADTLALVASDPESPLARGLDVVVEQRFAA